VNRENPEKTEKSDEPKRELVTHRIKLPHQEEGGPNYIGIIIGPKAKTLRDMEDKTGCRI